MKRIAIFGSGSGSNAEKILDYFAEHPSIEVGLVVSNKANAGILQHAFDYNVHTWVIDKKAINSESIMQEVLDAERIDYIVLAGFLWHIPSYLIQKFKNKIINIHPSLLPKYGGKGMYGANVHKAVFENKETESGITIHTVNEIYDDGEVFLQIKCNIEDCKDPIEIANKVLNIEHKYFALAIEKWIMNATEK